MDSKVYLDRKVQEAHYRDLLREAEKRRLLAQLPQYRRPLITYAIGKFGVLLLKLGTRLKQFELTYSVPEDHR